MKLSTTAAVAVVVLGVASQTAEGFAPVSVGLPKANLRLRNSQCSVTMKERPDGADPRDVEKAWGVYKDLMRSNNNGKGYWMDDPFQFFSNIKTALKRNFGDNNSMDLGLASPKQQGEQKMDLKGSPFSSLLSAEDLEELLDDEPAPMAKKADNLPMEKKMDVAPKKTKKKVTPPSAGSAESSSDDEKLAAIEAARKKKAADAAALKAKLSE